MGFSLKRRKGETFWVGDAKITSLGTQTAKLLIEAPRDMPIIRGELLADGEKKTEVEQKKVLTISGDADTIVES